MTGDQLRSYDNVKKILFLGLAVGQSFSQAKKSTTTLGRAKAIMGSADELIDMLTLDLDAVETEWENMGEAEYTALTKEASEHFELDDKELELKIEESITLGFDFMDLLHRGAQIWSNDKG